MSRSVDDCRKREIGDRGPLVLQPNEIRKSALSDPLELVCRERWVERDIREESQCAIQLSCRGVERQRARLPAAGWGQIDAEECNLIRDLEALPCRRSFTQHRRGEIGHSCFARWVGSASAPDEQDEVSKWQLVLLDDHQLDAVRE